MTLRWSRRRTETKSPNRKNESWDRKQSWRSGKRVPGLSTRLEKDANREVLFWLLLLGSWELLASPDAKAGIAGATGTAAFLLFAWTNLGRLDGLGLDHARWRVATGTDWLYAVASGVFAGVAIFTIGSASGQNMGLSREWRLVLLQVTLGPVLEEVVFRGFLFILMTWSLRRFAEHGGHNQLVVVASALVFALVHMTQPGVGWLQLACITSTGTLYGWLRCRSGSVAPAAVSHAVYNLSLYAITGVKAVLCAFPSS
jgi:membrane protease YdiL (CAAX protease family)